MSLLISKYRKVTWQDVQRALGIFGTLNEKGETIRMKTVKIGSARINENGTVSGGKAGDQTKQEVSTQNWYLHSKGWNVIRAKRPEVAAAIARNMQAACDNDHIGYCQAHRSSAAAEAKQYGYDLSKVTRDCEADCSELVRVCCLYAGIHVGTFSTASEVAVLKATGEFDILTDDKYCKSSAYLLRGDILVTKTKGHTVVVLDNGTKATEDQKPTPQTPEKVVEALYKSSTLSGAYKAVTDLHMRFQQGVLTPDNVVCVIPAGKTVRCYGFYNMVKGVKWYLVVHNGKVGYASSKYLERI